MTSIARRRVALAAMTVLLAIAAIVAGVITPPRPAQAQPNPSIFAKQPPTACVCASPVSVFGSGDAQIAHCQCGALQCAAATATGGVTLQCSR